MVDYPKDLDGLRWEKDAAMDEDPEIRVIVIRGANGLYSSGGDIAGFLKVERDGMHDLAWNVAAPERARKPVVAAIEKWAMGGGFRARARG